MLTSLLQILLVIFSLSHEAKLATATQIRLPTTQDSEGETNKCFQTGAEQASFIQKAEKNSYVLRRLEFYGNSHTRDDLMRRKLLLNEGDLFTRRKLIKSIQRLNSLGVFEPVRITDVLIRLNEQERLVDMVICFREKQRVTPRREASFQRRRQLTRCCSGRAVSAALKFDDLSAPLNTGVKNCAGIGKTS